jgi:nucleoside-diphosphate-sugar epimerase
MKKVLVTGCSGFIGNYVVRQLLQNNCQVIATSVDEGKARHHDWFSQVTWIPFNLQKDTDVTVFGQLDAVIHLAWEGLPNYKSLFHFEENLPVHYHFLKNLIAHGVTDVTVTGTCFEYGMQEGMLKEDTPTLPANPYALAKDTLRKFLSELQKLYPFDFKWVRLFYLYGEGQNPNAILSQLQKAILNKEPAFKMSGGEQIRDYLPVEKVAENIVKIALQNTVTGIINCSSGAPITVKQLVQNYLQEHNVSIPLQLGFYPYPDYEPMAFWGDNTKLKEIR